MNFTSPGSILLQLGPLAIRWYGLLIALGMGLAYWYIKNELARRKMESKDFEDMLLWVVFSGILGARLYYVLFSFGYYRSNPAEILQLWHGGLAIHGALIGGAVAFTIFSYIRRISWFTYTDIIIPGVLLAQAVGRWGNFFNSEAFGTPTTLPWGVLIPAESRPQGFEAEAYYHPTFLYESLWNFFGFLLLVVLSRKLYGDQKKHKAGIIFFVYLMWYSLGRFFIEALRTDSLYFGPLRVAQIASVILFAVGMVGVILLRHGNSIFFQTSRKG